MKNLLFGLGIVVSLYAIATPYIEMWNLQSIVASQNTHGFTRQVDFASVESSFEQSVILLIEDVESELVSDSWASAGAEITKMLIGEELFDASVEIYGEAKVGAADDIANQMATPDNLLEILGTGALLKYVGLLEPEEQPSPQDGFGISVLEIPSPSMRYEGIHKFVVDFKTDYCSQSQLILERRGLDWVVTEVLLGSDCQ